MTSADKMPNNEKQAAAGSSIDQQSSNRSTFQFVDNRPDTVMQRKLQESINKSQKVSQMRAFQERVDKYSKNKANLNALQVNAPVQLKEVHTISRDRTPSIHQFTQQAIDEGAPTTLTYLVNKNSSVYVQNEVGRIYTINSVPQEEIGTKYFPITLHDLNRLKALGKGVQLNGESKEYANGFSRDEYPYASTLEGGTDSFWAYVPVAEQHIQGGQLASLYRRVVESNDAEFDVELQ